MELWAPTYNWWRGPPCMRWIFVERKRARERPNHPHTKGPIVSTPKRSIFSNGWKWWFPAIFVVCKDLGTIMKLKTPFAFCNEFWWQLTLAAMLGVVAGWSQVSTMVRLISLTNHPFSECWKLLSLNSIMAGQPTTYPPDGTTLTNTGLIAGLIKGHQWFS